MKKMKVIGMIAIISLIWGYLWVTVKIGLQDIPPFLFSSLRLLIGALVLVIVLIFRKHTIWPKRNEWLPFLNLGLLMCVGFYAISTYGMQFVDSGVSSVLVYTSPIIVSLLAHFMLNERLTLTRIIGLFIGFLGLLFIMGSQLFDLSFNLSLLGKGIIILSSFFWASASIYTKKVGHAYHKIKMTMWQMLLGGTIILIFSLATEHTEIVEMTVSSSSIIALLYNGILGSAVAFVGWNWVLDKIQASVASMSLMSVPLLGLFFGWLQLGEAITRNIIIGAILVSLGILLTSIQINKPNNKKLKRRNELAQ